MFFFQKGEPLKVEFNSLTREVNSLTKSLNFLNPGVIVPILYINYKTLFTVTNTKFK